MFTTFSIVLGSFARDTSSLFFNVLDDEDGGRGD